jgi:hypothetical protein
MMIHGPLIKTKFLGPTTHREPRIMASHQRDSQRTWRKATYWNPKESALENHRLAALALIRSSPMADWQAQIVASGFDQDHYYWIVSTPSMASG